jgi:formiminotetrahydrofolate cyclodeaminase
VAQPAKSQAAARGQDAQTARGQDAQTARGQDAQVPRNVAKGRSVALANARRLVNEAEVACKDADSQRAASNAHAAMELLKYLP